MDNNEIYKIDDNLYSDKNCSEELIEKTKAILSEIDEEFVDKVVRIKIKGQIDGN